jgi:predicted AAA+ superfamily ATPase
MTMPRTIPREALESRTRAALRANPVVALLGPRQCGKTTLARRLVSDSGAEYFDLEDPVGAARLAAPMSALAPLRGLVVIDEVQREPGLFPVLRVLVDRPRQPARFLLLGSASPELVRQGSETLAGRIAFVEMGGFNLTEVTFGGIRRLWLRGGFPRSYLARTDGESLAWRNDFIRTFLERDIAQLRVRIPAPAVRRLWMMLAHYHAQVWNASEIGRSLGEAHTTIRRHLDVLVGTFMVRELQPWFVNIGKRQVRSTKVYIRDTGILHALLGLGSFASIEGHPKLGASWEGFVIEQAILSVGERNAFFWATQAGAELDLLLLLEGRRIGVEVKYADAPAITKSMRIALGELQLDKLYVVHPGTQRYPMEERIEAVPPAGLLSDLRASAGTKRKRRSARG